MPGSVFKRACDWCANDRALFSPTGGVKKDKNQNSTYELTDTRILFSRNMFCSAINLHVECTRCVPVAVLACTRMKSDNGNRPTESVCDMDTVVAFMCLAERHIPMYVQLQAGSCTRVRARMRAPLRQHTHQLDTSHVGRQCGWHMAFLIGIALTKYDDRSSMPHFDPGKAACTDSSLVSKLGFHLRCR